jgi:hypothetical protein
MTISDDPLLCGPHSAVDGSPPPPDGVNAGPRAQAREGTPDSAQSGAQFTAQSIPTLSEHLAETRGRWLAWVTPPDIWSQDRPGLSKTWAYASRGAWARPTGPSRRLGQAYVAVVAFPVKAACQLIDWLVERPSRLVAAGVLLVVLAQFPPVAWLF